MKNNKMAFLFESKAPNSPQAKVNMSNTNIPSLKNSGEGTISVTNNIELNLKGLDYYNKILNSYISKWNNKNLILSMKKKISKGEAGQSVNLNKQINNLNNKLNSNETTTSLLKEKTYGIEGGANKNIINNYIKSLSKFNTYLDGIVFNYKQQINYNFSSISSNNILIKKIYPFLLFTFSSMNSLISKPVFEFTSQKVVIHLFFYIFKNNNKNVRGYANSVRNASAAKVKSIAGAAPAAVEGNTFLRVNKIKLNILCQILSRYFKKPVELDLVRLHYPYLDSNIFVNLLQILINKIKLRIIMQKFFKKAIIKNPIKSNNNVLNKIPSFLSGIKIKIGGRLLTNKVVPRQTVKIVRRGALSRAKINFLDVARYTNKNKRGTYSITVSTGHYLSAVQSINNNNK
jgi:hypothetical protein